MLHPRCCKFPTKTCNKFSIRSFTSRICSFTLLIYLFTFSRDTVCLHPQFIYLHYTELHSSKRNHRSYKKRRRASSIQVGPSRRLQSKHYKDSSTTFPKNTVRTKRTLPVHKENRSYPEPCHVLHFTLISAREITKCRLPLLPFIGFSVLLLLVGRLERAHGRVPGALSSRRAYIYTHTLQMKRRGLQERERARASSLRRSRFRCRSWNTERSLDNRLSICGCLECGRAIWRARGMRRLPEPNSITSARTRRREFHRPMERPLLPASGSASERAYHACTWITADSGCCSAASATHSLDSVGRSPRVPLGRFVRVSRAADGFRLTRTAQNPPRKQFRYVRYGDRGTRDLTTIFTESGETMSFGCILPHVRQKFEKDSTR